MDTPSDIPLPPEFWETIPPEARNLLQKKINEMLTDLPQEKHSRLVAFGFQAKTSSVFSACPEKMQEAIVRSLDSETASSKEMHSAIIRKTDAETTVLLDSQKQNHELQNFQIWTAAGSMLAVGLLLFCMLGLSVYFFSIGKDGIGYFWGSFPAGGILMTIVSKIIAPMFQKNNRMKK